ncbi:MAG: nucleotidyltransferase domain-containing protein [Chloroflexi bacterium]|nr:nucleotidyltransferase domain-containing protein [Chloroflexota bacterium]
MADTEDALLRRVVERLVEVFQPEEIYLFGSRARGDWREDSDYDLMVIVPTSDLPPYRRAQQAHLALQSIRVPKDVTIWTREEFARYLPVTASLAASVVREGRRLYAV